jgi:hypothetical protein
MENFCLDLTFYNCQYPDLAQFSMKFVPTFFFNMIILLKYAKTVINLTMASMCNIGPRMPSTKSEDVSNFNNVLMEKQKKNFVIIILKFKNATLKNNTDFNKLMKTIHFKGIVSRDFCVLFYFIGKDSIK